VWPDLLPLLFLGFPVLFVDFSFTFSFFWFFFGASHSFFFDKLETCVLVGFCVCRLTYCLRKSGPTTRDPGSWRAGCPLPFVIWVIAVKAREPLPCLWFNVWPAVLMLYLHVLTFISAGIPAHTHTRSKDWKDSQDTVSALDYRAKKVWPGQEAKWKWRPNFPDQQAITQQIVLLMWRFQSEWEVQIYKIKSILYPKKIQNCGCEYRRF